MVILTMFEAHGSFTTQVCGGVLLVDILGPWNLETALDYQRAINDITVSLLGEPWAMITNLYEWELYTPDCFPVIHNLVNTCIENGLCKEAILSPEKSVKKRPFQIKRPHAPQFERKFFVHYESARVWLENQNFFAPVK